MATALTILAAYCIGSVSFAIVVSRLMRLPDPRSYGSKNPGTTNVLRSGKKMAAVLTLAGDAGKGWLAVWLAAQLGGDVPAAGIAVFLGHLYPVFHRFQGGKGVATAAGVLLGFDARLGLAVLAAWIIVAATSRYSSLAALVAAITAPVCAWFLGADGGVVVVVTAIALLLIWRHRENIARLAAGTESQLGRKKEANPPDPNAASR
ncbi:MAG TPA: glycerol-3-phosphate 1-O-acyltransferase PlsY [Burkholderiales bacterium]|nr:glycerol-3-phosphate 1-O-acyltransferase PlsY [Burkholderiales bacterium]